MSRSGKKTPTNEYVRPFWRARRFSIIRQSQAKATMSRDYISSERLQQLRTSTGRSSIGPDGRRDSKGGEQDGKSGPPGRRTRECSVVE